LISIPFVLDIISFVFSRVSLLQSQAKTVMLSLDLKIPYIMMVQPLGIKFQVI
jgi:hypothetical protein